MPKRKTGSQWHKIRAVVIKRAGGLCQVCCSRPAVEVTHKVKRRISARYDLDNLIAVCEECHRGYDAERDAAAKRASLRRRETETTDPSSDVDGSPQDG